MYVIYIVEQICRSVNQLEPPHHQWGFFLFSVGRYLGTFTIFGIITSVYKSSTASSLVYSVPIQNTKLWSDKPLKKKSLTFIFTFWCKNKIHCGLGNIQDFKFILIFFYHNVYIYAYGNKCVCIARFSLVIVKSYDQKCDQKPEFD